MRRRKRIQMKVMMVLGIVALIGPSHLQALIPQIILTLAEDRITATSRYVSSGYFSVQIQRDIFLLQIISLLEQNISLKQSH